jgi:hypothetical protein
MIEQRVSSAGLAPTLAVVGGILAIAGSVLNWATFSAGGFSVSAKGIDGLDGFLTIICGVLLLTAGVATFTGMIGGKSRLRVSALVGGLGAAGIGLYDALTAEHRLIEEAADALAHQLGIAVDAARTAVQQAINQGQIAVSVDVGLYVVIAGGIIGIVAGILAMTSVPARARTPSPGSGLTGWYAPAPLPPPPPMPVSAPTERSSPWAIPEPTPPSTSAGVTEASVSQTTPEGGDEPTVDDQGGQPAAEAPPVDESPVD